MAPTATLKPKARKRKLIKKADKKIKKKKIKTLAQTQTLEPSPPTTNDTTTNDESTNDTPTADSDPEPEPNSKSDATSDPETDTIQSLLEPYTKEQLIEFLVDAAVGDAALADRIREVADRDVSHRKIFIHGLGWDATKETLASVFGPFGQIEDSNVVTDRVTGKAKGYGFVLFKSRIGAMKALKDPRKRIGSRIAWCQLASVGPMAPTQGGDTAARKIYVSNVQGDVDSEKLRAFFAKFGEIETGPIGFDMQTGKSRGFALFVYKTIEGARKVLEEPYKMFEGHQLHCQKAAEGKNKAAATAVQAPVLAGQNLALLGQNPALNPMYNALFAANPNAALIAAAQGGMAGGFGGYGAPGVPIGLGAYGSSVGAYGAGSGAPVMGLYGSGAPALQGQYPNLHNAQSSAANPNGVGGSFVTYPSYMCFHPHLGV